MLQRAKLGAGMLAIGVAAAVWPAATASATIDKAALCTAYKSQIAKQEAGSSKVAKEMESGNWAQAKKGLLSAFSSEAAAQKETTAFLNGAPGQVKSAAGVVLKLEASFKSIIQKSTSATQFETGITAAESTPKVTAALKVLDAYTKKLCGTITP